MESLQSPCRVPLTQIFHMIFHLVESMWTPCGWGLKWMRTREGLGKPGMDWRWTGLGVEGLHKDP
jgi:hypothetical protein